ncbi:DMT family transporter [Labrys monachus]|uniref:Drug/metabolite transporter (DMT)-like permease n=1 Tax=Labrys monachus TaxID=217067 RepID=A0ABU0FI78_9HYPH|nr:DMT family transporter [Labrys monachus]MDQ0394312.1 drug/metabolite transporter (DMT)-like permease [Labrys monachus]
MTLARSPWSGIASMVLATGLFIVSDSLMKLAAHDMPFFQAVFLRSLFGLVFCAGLVGLSGQWRRAGGALHWRSFARGAGEAAATFVYIIALAQMPIADAIAIGQTAPLLMILALALVFGERIGAQRAVLVCLGFLGAVLVAQPGASGLSPAALFAFLTAAIVVLRDLVARGIPASIPPFVVMLTTSAVMAATTGYASFHTGGWIPPAAPQWLMMMASGLAVMLGQVSIFMSYRNAPASVVAPFYYSFTLWAVIAGFVVWREIPNPLALAGMVLIVASGLALLLAAPRRVEAVA